MIQGKIYDQLYSPAGLARLDIERGVIAQTLASELREMIDENKIAFQVASNSIIIIIPGAFYS